MRGGAPSQTAQNVGTWNNPGKQVGNMRVSQVISNHRRIKSDRYEDFNVLSHSKAPSEYIALKENSAEKKPLHSKLISSINERNHLRRASIKGLMPLVLQDRSLAPKTAESTVTFTQRSTTSRKNGSLVGRIVPGDQLNLNELRMRNVPEQAKNKMLAIGRKREERLQFSLLPNTPTTAPFSHRNNNK